MFERRTTFRGPSGRAEGSRAGTSRGGARGRRPEAVRLRSSRRRSSAGSRGSLYLSLALAHTMAQILPIRFQEHFQVRPGSGAKSWRTPARRVARPVLSAATPASPAGTCDPDFGWSALGRRAAAAPADPLVCCHQSVSRGAAGQGPGYLDR